MKTNEATVFVFMASIIVGILISMNINFGEKSKVFLGPEDYAQAYNKRNKLYKDIANMKEEYYKVYEKLDKYKNNDENDYAILKEIQKEISRNRMALGLQAVEGEGIKITLNDAESTSFGDYYDIYSLVHDFDVLGVINDLRNAGAEAIAINGQRVVYNTYSYCAGTNIDLGGMKIVAPFYISAIGNKKVLKNYMLLNDNSYYKRLIGRDVRTEIQESDNVKIPAYNGKLTHNFMEVVEK